MTPVRKHKVSRACDSCKARKKKCDGTQPCPSCITRQIYCSYMVADKRRTRYGGYEYGSDSTTTTPTSPSSKTYTNGGGHFSSNNIGAGNTGNLSADESSMMIPDDSDTPYMKTAPPAHSTTHSHSHPQFDLNKVPQSLRALLNVPTPSSSSMDKPHTKPVTPINTPPNCLSSSTASDIMTDFKSDTEPVHRYDGEETQTVKAAKPKFPWNRPVLYCSNSSTLGYLHACREICSSSPVMSLENTQFLTEIKPRPQSTSRSSMKASSNRLLPLIEYTEFVIDLFLVNMNHLIYIIHPEDFKKKFVQAIYSDPINASREQLCLLNAVLGTGSLFARALAAQTELPFKDIPDPEIFLNNATEIAAELPETYSVFMVQIPMAIGSYLLFSNDLHAAWIQLNIAIKRAELLGLNTDSANEAYEDEGFVQHRKMLWRALFVADRLLSPQVGKSLCIADLNIQSVRAPLAKSCDFIENCQVQLAKACEAIGEVHTYTYFERRDAQFPKLKELGLLLRRWFDELPYEFKLPAVLELEDYVTSKNANADLKETRYAFHPLYVIYLSYSYALFLLTRPCYHFIIQRELRFNSADDAFANAPLGNPSIIKDFAETGYIASKFLITFAQFFLKKGWISDRPFMFVGIMFRAGLTMGLAYYAQTVHLNYNSSRPIDIDFLKENNKENLLECISALNNFAGVDANASRFRDILQAMHDSISSKDNHHNTFGEFQYEGKDRFAYVRHMEEHVFKDLEEMTEESQAGDMAILRDFNLKFNKGPQVGTLFNGTF